MKGVEQQVTYNNRFSSIREELGIQKKKRSLTVALLFGCLFCVIVQHKEFLLSFMAPVCFSFEVNGLQELNSDEIENDWTKEYSGSIEKSWGDVFLSQVVPVLMYSRQYGLSQAQLYSSSSLNLESSTGRQGREAFAISQSGHIGETDEKKGDMDDVIDTMAITEDGKLEVTEIMDASNDNISDGALAAASGFTGSNLTGSDPNAMISDSVMTDHSITDNFNNIILAPVYSKAQLSEFNFLLSHCYTVDSTTYVDETEMNADTLLAMDMSLDQDNSDYQILIYHTHSSSETFADSRPGVLEDTPIGLGDTLTTLLEGYGYKVYHDRTVYDQINGKVDRNYAYTASGEAIDRILTEHPSIEVVIDLHRDGLNEHTHLVTEINGKPTAKIMFFNGVSRTVRNGELAYLANPNRQANLAFSLQLYLTGEAAFDNYLRHIYIKGYQYNLDRRPRATLIEVGGQTNTVEEANNAMEPLAYILHEVLSGNRAWE